MKNSIVQNLIHSKDSPENTIPIYNKQKIKKSDSKAIQGFIKGPISLQWLSPILKPNKSHLVLGAIIVLHLSNLIKSNQFRFQYSMASKFGLSKASARKVLIELHELGLISITRVNGKSPEVKIILSEE